MTVAYAAELDPEHAVIQAIRAGDRDAFEGFVRRQSRWVRGVIFGILGDQERIEDVAQQVWQTVWTRSDSLRSVSGWRPWLYRLTRNAALDSGREQTRRKRLAQQAAEGPSQRSTQTPEGAAISRERQQLVLNAIAGLPASYREPFVLRHIEGWSYQQIAETMDMPTATVETRLVRARRLLREALADKV